jgi:hypothetical protein
MKLLRYGRRGQEKPGMLDSGLGLKPPQYLRPGQTMRLVVEGLGEQQQRTAAAR